MSRERVGTELNGILKAARPDRAVRLLTDMRLLEVTFAPKSIQAALTLYLGGESLTITEEDLQATIPSTFALIYSLANELSKEEVAQLNFDEKRILILASILAPLRSVYTRKKAKTIPLTNTIILEALKLRAQVGSVTCAPTHSVPLTGVVSSSFPSCAVRGSGCARGRATT